MISGTEPDAHVRSSEKDALRLQPPAAQVESGELAMPAGWTQRAVDRTRLDWIDALRGYAVLAVFMIHSAQAVPMLTRFFDWGARGVQLFFVISAFTLAMSWRSRHEPAGHFYLRRAFRILPMFWLALAFYAATGAPDRFAAWQIALTALLLHGLHPATVNLVVPGDWSVAVEAYFYALFPLVMTRVTTWRRAALAFVIAAIWAMTGAQRGFALAAFGGPAVVEWWFLSLPVQLIAFASGLAAYWCTFGSAGSLVLSRRTAEIIVAVGVVALVYLGSRADPRMTTFSAAFGLLVIGMANGGGRWLVCRPIRHLGKISYSAYLIHFAVLWRIDPLVDALNLSSWTAYGLTLASVALVTAALATITYRLIEKPMNALASRLVAKAALNAAAARPSGAFAGSSPPTERPDNRQTRECRRDAELV